jgi:Flp pilus assembly protein CpaB
MAAPRSTQLVVIGVAVFVIGAGLVFLGLTDDEQAAPASAPSTAPSARASVVATTGAVPGQKTPVAIPSNMQAVAIELSGAPALPGYIRAGDHVNVHVTVSKGRPGAKPEPPFSKLLYSGVTVLDARGIEGGGTKPMYVLALGARDAEKLIYFAKFESLWLTVQPPGQGPVTTPGKGYTGRL